VGSTAQNKFEIKLNNCENLKFEICHDLTLWPHTDHGQFDLRLLHYDAICYQTIAEAK